jgi:hypothetical protein
MESGAFAFWLPSEYVAVSVYVCTSPGSRVTFAGVNAMDSNTGGSTTPAISVTPTSVG